MADILVVLDDGWPDLSEAAVSAGVARAMERWGERVAYLAKALAPKDTGVLAGSYQAQVYGTATEMFGVVSSPLTYAETMEMGRTPGAGFPPRGVLKGWMDRHPAPAWVMEKYPTEEARESALRWAIHIKGIVPHPHLRPAFDAEVDNLAPLIAQEVFQAGGTAPPGRAIIMEV